MIIRSSLLAAIAALVAFALAPHAALASKNQESILEDETRLLSTNSAEQQAALDEAVALGADTIRNLVLWDRFTPRRFSTKRPAGFDGTNPADYPDGAWDALDGLVRGAQARGLGLILSPSTPVPLWATPCRSGPVKQRQVCRPRAKLFGDFVEALGRRYSGSYADENQGGGALPRVRRWSIGNEPNQKGWLYPQRERKGGQVIGTAAVLYRSLTREAIKGLRATGHRRDQILLGETAPLGSTTAKLARRSMQPGLFLRELFCLTRSGARMTGAAARLRGCRSFSRLPVSAYAHHPYTKGGFAHPRIRLNTDEITVAAAPRLYRILDAAARRGRVPRGLGVFYTEFGFQTNPPDRISSTSLAEQALYLNDSDHIAYQDPRVRSVAQYKLVDDVSPVGFQTGLRFIDGTRKPSWGAWRVPIHVIRSGSKAVRVYGQLRPAADGAVETVQIQRKAGGGSFETVRTITVRSRKGNFKVKVGRSGGSWRLRWEPSAGGEALFSRDAKPARR